MYGASKRIGHRERRRRTRSPDAPPTQKRGFWATVERLRIKIEVVAVVTAAVAFVGQAYFWYLETEDRRVDRKVAAWQVLTEKTPGNTGKVEALHYLYSVGEPLDAIDLSCETHSGTWDAGRKWCKRPVHLRNLALPSADLSGSNLRGVDLREANLSDADLTAADLSGADLIRANLGGAELWLAKLSGAELTRANLRGARLPTTNLSDANLTGADLSDASLRHANLRSAHLWRTNLSRADLTAAELSGVYLREGNLSGASLRDVNLSGADLVKSDLSGANLSGANVSNVDARDAILGGELTADSLPPFACEGNEPTNWPNTWTVVVVKGGEAILAAYETSLADDAKLMRKVRVATLYARMKENKNGKWVDIFPCKS